MRYDEMTDKQRAAEFKKVGVSKNTRVRLATGEEGAVRFIDYEGAWLYNADKFVRKVWPWSFSGINAAKVIK